MVLDRVTRGLLAGTIGCIVKSTVNATTNRLGWMGMRNSTVWSDIVLGKSLMKRKGTTQWIVGEIASSQLGCFWGGIMGGLPQPQGKNAWIVRGMLVGSLAWMIDMGLGARSIPRAVQGDVSAKDALMWWTQHLVFGITASYLLDGNPDVVANIKQYVQKARAKQVAGAVHLDDQNYTRDSAMAYEI